MKSFLKTLLAVILGIFVSFFLVLVILIVILASTEEKIVIEPNSILKLTLDKEIIERTDKNPFSNIDILGIYNTKQIGLKELIENIKKAKYDDNIKGIYLELSSIDGGITTIKEIRKSLIDFKQSGKFLIAYGDYYSQGSYYLASVADSVFLNPEGSVELRGLNSQILFYKKVLEKIGIEAELIRHGKYKSAAEPFVSDKMSLENKEQFAQLLTSIWNDIVLDISASRKINVNTLNKLADDLEAYNPKTCLKYRLIDSTIYKDQVNEILLSLSGTKQKEPKFVDLSKYEKVPITNQLKFSKNKIALIYAYGDVVLGSGDEGTVSSERISEAIRNARTDTSIKAIVLRVNSPGGSAIASEIIWRELKLATKTKPVVASFGDYAASGGYYIACAANKIVAEPTTITGSLGVFGLMLHGKELLNNKLGITTENIKTNRHSDFPSYTRPLDEAEKKFMQNEIDRIYNTFINHVAEGRKMKTDDVDKIAQGRVWSGIDAYNVKLVDTLGTISDAISLAAQLANINNYRVVHLPKLEEPFEKILKEIGSTKIKINIPPYTDVYYYLEKISKFYDIQARLPFEIKIY